MKNPLKSKTIWLAVIQGVLGVIVAVSTTYPELGGIMILKSMLDIILRVITTMPVDIPQRGRFE